MKPYTFFPDKPIEEYHKSDLWFIVSVILLAGIGIFTLYFCSQNYAYRIFNYSFYFVRRQLVSVFIGLFAFIFFAALKIDVIRKLLPSIIIITFILCVLTFIPPLSVEKNGARRWLKMPFRFTLQTSECVKFSLVMFLANYFDRQLSAENQYKRSLFPSVFIMLVYVGLVLFQKDLSTSVFIFGVCFLMYVACGLKIRWIFAVAIVAIPVLFLFITTEPYRIDRIIAFLKPEEGIHTFNYQSMAAKRAISSGGVWGAGIGSELVQSNRIPEVQADYIFAGWAEAFGLIGVLCYIALLVFFALRGYRCALTCKNRFASYTSFGFITMILLQSLANIGVVCGALPATGIPLPFFSLGGTSIIFTLAMCGFVVNASRYNTDNDLKADTFIEVNSIGGVTVYE